MRHTGLPTLLLGMILLLPAFNPAAYGNDDGQYWPQWRGPLATGEAPAATPPLTWSEEKNVRWKVALPGRGHSTPIVWSEQIFITTARESAGAAPGEETPRGRRGGIKPDAVHQFVIFALNRNNGTILWERVLRENRPHEGTHLDGSWASNSAITDGEHLYAYFGSNGLYCLDLQGNLLWEKDLGDMQTRMGFGEGSSPVLHGDKLVINWDHEGDSFIIALDKRSGKTVWKVARDEVTSWSTPLIVEHGGRAQVIVSATGRVRGYNLTDGKVLWESTGMTTNTIPSPVHHDGMVYVMSGFRGNALQAIRLSEARGDISGSAAIAWEYNQDTPYVPSPLLYRGNLYFLKHNRGILTALDLQSGAVIYGPQRLDIDGAYASPVGANGHIYIAGLDGTVLVLKHGDQFEVAATNQLDDRFSASPVMVGKQIFLRGERYLYCIAE